MLVQIRKILSSRAWLRNINRVSFLPKYVPIFRYFKQYFESIEKDCLHINGSASMLNVLKGIYTFDDLRKRKTRKRMVK